MKRVRRKCHSPGEKQQPGQDGTTECEAPHPLLYLTVLFCKVLSQMPEGTPKREGLLMARDNLLERTAGRRELWVTVREARNKLVLVGGKGRLQGKEGLRSLTQSRTTA